MMSTVERKRPRMDVEGGNDQEVSETIDSKNQMIMGISSMPPSTNPLIGAIVCLSGFTSDKKDELHELVETLGGR